MNAGLAGPPPAAPPAAAFEALVHDFLYHAVWLAKKLRRGELWPRAAWMAT